MAFEPQLTKRFGVKDSHTLKVSLETGGYASLEKLFKMKPELRSTISLNFELCL